MPRLVATLLLLVVVVGITTVSSCCPNECSNHGHCKTFGNGCACDCFTGFTSGDCSQRSCPFGKSWSSPATATEVGHTALSECSDRGLCDRLTGTCECADGFTGAACNRQSCPQSCSGHGECQSMSYLSSQKDLGTGPAVSYDSVWDHDMIYSCACEDGYTGPDCSLRQCPTGDDPLTTTSQFNEKQTISCSATSGTFTLAYKGYTTALIDYDASSSVVHTKLSALPSLSSISVTYPDGVSTACTAGSANTITVEFLQDFGPLPLLIVDGALLAHSGLSSGTLESSVARIVTGTKENSPCSNRGKCDSTTGVCSCYTGYDTSNGYGTSGDRGDCGAATSTITSCPGDTTECSGNGYCTNSSPEYRCVCNDGWDSGDCSVRTCPSGKAWADIAATDNVGHTTDTECSGAGFCDTTTGECQCVSGFEGAACERMTCPNDCSNHGQCLLMSDLARLSRQNGVLMSYTYGDLANVPDTWDAGRISGCYCDSEYTGFDCSERVCPSGDNPRTTGQVREVQTVVCTQTAGSTTLRLSFRSEITAEIASDASASVFQEALEALSSIEFVGLSYSSGVSACTTDGSNIISVEFIVPSGDVPDLIYVPVTGTLVTSVTIDTDGTGSSVQGTTEDVQCSDNGICNTVSGRCECFTGVGSSDGGNNKGHREDCGYISEHYLSRTDSEL